MKPSKHQQLLAILVIPLAALLEQASTAQTSTSYKYDTRGRLTGTDAHSNVAGDVSSTYQYDAADNRMRVIVTKSGGTDTATANWSFCSSENSACNISGTPGDQWQIRYGTDPAWNYQTVTLDSPVKSIGCDNATFGDPVVGTLKHCDIRRISASLPTSWATCAAENQTCSLSGISGQRWEIQYGVDPNWSSSQYITQSGSSAQVQCSNAQFGDPYPGTVKSCRARRVQ